MKKMMSVILLVCTIVGCGGVSAFAVEEDGIQAVDAVTADSAPTQRRGDELVAQVGDVRAELPMDPNELLTVQAADGPQVFIGLPQGDEASGRKATREGAGALSHNLGDNATIVPAVRSNGVVQILAVLHDELAPTSFSYDITVDEGGSMVSAPDGGVRLLGSDRQEVASVAAPWAVDAVGSRIPTTFLIEGSRLTQVVDTAAVQNVQYPVVADPAVSVTYYRYDPVEVRRTFNWTNKAVQLAVCKVHWGASRGTCTMQNSYEVESSVGTSFGVDKGVVSAGLNINGSKKVTGTVSWTSAPAPAGSSFKAWAVGTRVTFRLQKWVGHRTLEMAATRWRLDSTSSTLEAFEPQVGFAVGQ